MTENPGNIPWQIENIRVTLFSKNNLNPNNLESWLESVTKLMPEQIVKRQNSFFGISRTEDGEFRINWNTTRIDILLGSSDPMNNLDFIPFTKTLELFDKYFNKIPEMNETFDVQRVAVGIILSANVEDQTVGIKLISTQIPSLQIDPESRDFLYRVNHPQKSNINPEFELNRLVIWSVSIPQLVEVILSTDGTQSQEIRSEKTPQMRLEIDINTDGKTDINTENSKLLPLLTELQRIAIGIIEHGEIINPQ